MFVHKYNSSHYVAYQLSCIELNDAVFPTIPIFCLMLFMFKLPISCSSNIYIQLKEKSIIDKLCGIFLALFFNQGASLHF